ncbi:MAG: S49 family peptidase [Hyphomonas sp.]|nr:S49 family peptidase [Hyphomonas sp.]
MKELAIGRALWAMHPAALADIFRTAVNPDRLHPLAQLFLGMSADARTTSQDALAPVRNGVATIIHLSGALSPLGSWGGTGLDQFVDQVRHAAHDRAVGVIILKIMSPGGTVWGTVEAADAVFEARKSKPVIAVADKYSFSAAHWIASQASAYYATPSGQVGSVGVMSGHVDMSGFESKIGMKTTLIASDPRKVAGHPHAPLCDLDRAEMQAEIDEMAAAFVAAIARGRGVERGRVTKVHGSGEVFSAKQAAQRGMVDGVMTMREVITRYSVPSARLALMRERDALAMGIAILQ